MSDPFSFEDDESPNSADSGDGGSAQVKFTKPPFAWLAAGAGLSIAGGLLAWLGNSLPLAVGGWFLAGPLGLTLLAWFLNRDSRAKVGGVYLAPSWTLQVYVASVVVCLVAVVLAAIRVSLGVGRL
jgi:hypothetical protein